MSKKRKKIEEKLIKLVRQVVEDWGAEVESGKAISKTDAADALVKFVTHARRLLQEHDAEQESIHRAQNSLIAMLQGRDPRKLDG